MNVIAVINEEVKRLFEQQVYTIPQLAGLMGSRMKHDANTVQIYAKMLWDAYKEGGDDAVVDMYTKMAGVEIQALRNGRYMFANLYTPEDNEPKLEEVIDNANHCPDEMPS